jgi:DNA-binding Xre family transcriptional regulator
MGDNVTKRMGTKWLLRERMEQQRLTSTSDLLSLLAERGVHLSRMQVYRLATQEPQRLSLDLLAALCDILECTPNDLITVTAVKLQEQKRVGEVEVRSTKRRIQPAKARLRRPNE